MRKIFMLILVLVMMCSCTPQVESENADRLSKMKKSSVIPVFQSGERNEYEPLNYDEMKAMWISYIDLAPMLTSKSKSEFENNFEIACEKIAELGCNTIYVHVRPFGDALYYSSLYPISQYVSGQVGECADFDPLKIICDIAHEKKLSVQAWINPLRLETEANFQYISDDLQIKKWYNEDNGYVRAIDGDKHLWLNPAFEDVQKLISDGAEEIAENYEVDGIHYDDYFYPTTDETFDAQCYTELSDGKSLSQWRLDNISSMAEKIYSKVKAVNSSIIVGVSPQGNIENNYAYMYADVKKWCSSEGYIDYIAPQIYYGYNNSVKPFSETLQAWKSLVTNDKISIVVGLAVYKIGVENEFTQTTGIISQQAEDSMKNGCGVAFYAYNNVFYNSEVDEKRMQEEMEYIKNSLNCM